jgi:hypothetical protein
MPMPDDQDVKIAVLNTQMEGIKDMLKDQNSSSEKRWDKLFEYIKPTVDFATQNQDMPKKVAILWDARNKQEGFFNASRFFSGGVGGALALIADYIIRKLGG